VYIVPIDYNNYRAPAFPRDAKKSRPDNGRPDFAIELANLISCCLGLVQGWQAQRSL